jgi:hypothetical protein
MGKQATSLHMNILLGKITIEKLKENNQQYNNITWKL